MTLIEVRNNDGLVGRCDARCYEAKDPHCDCICGGRNHGAGLEAARENTREMAEDLVERWGAEHPEERITIAPQQQELFA